MGRGHMLSSNMACVDGPDWPPLRGPDVDEGCSWVVTVTKRAFPSHRHQNVSAVLNLSESDWDVGDDYSFGLIEK